MRLISLLLVLLAASCVWASASASGSQLQGFSTSGTNVLDEIRTILGLDGDLDTVTTASVLQNLVRWIESKIPLATIVEMRAETASQRARDPVAPQVEFGTLIDDDDVIFYFFSQRSSLIFSICFSIFFLPISASFASVSLFSPAPFRRFKFSRIDNTLHALNVQLDSHFPVCHYVCIHNSPPLNTTQAGFLRMRVPRASAPPRLRLRRHALRRLRSPSTISTPPARRSPRQRLAPPPSS